MANAANGKGWAKWLEILPGVTAWAGGRWYDKHLREDILSEAAVIFCGGYRDQDTDAQVAKFAHLCCRRAARGISRQTRIIAYGDDRVEAAESIAAMRDSCMPSVTDDQQERILAVYRLACSDIRTMMLHVLRGDSLAEAASVVGWSPAQLSTTLARMGRRMTGGRPAVRQDPRTKTIGSAQLDLFAV